jgi:hypothetical protein
MNKVKKFYSDHKEVIFCIGGVAIGVAVCLLGSKIIRIYNSKHLIRIDPDYYDTIEEAVTALKELEKTTDFAAMCTGGDGKYGVFDEAPIIK